MFFDSADSLVPSDTNGTEDVYEYEPPGVGNCTGESMSFSAGSGGCVDLISSGISKEESAFVDASESGDDVFFLTSAQLSSTDTDRTPDVYDARVDGGFPQPQAPPACEGDACQSPVAPPNDPTPGSLTYRGPGNPGPLLTASKTSKKKPIKCARGKKLTHGKCVKSKEEDQEGEEDSDRRREAEDKIMRIAIRVQPFLLVLLTVMCVSVVGVSPVFAAEPWWQLSSGSRPANLKAGLATDEVQEVAVKSGSGTFTLTVTTGVGHATSTSGSNILANIVTTGGTLHLGDAVSLQVGTGDGGNVLPSNTSITAVGSEALMVSAATKEYLTGVLRAC